MPLTLHNLYPTKGSKKQRKRVGRGGKRGTYSGRGIKGQRSRSGGRKGLRRLGSKHLIEQTPKLKGFKSIHKKPEIVNLKDLDRYFKDGDKITPQILFKKGLVGKIKNGVKILGEGELSKKLSIENCKLSKSAKEKVMKAGGQVKDK